MTDSATQHELTSSRLLYLLLAIPLFFLPDEALSFQRSFPEPAIPFTPTTTVVYRTAEPLRIDGRLDEEAWNRTGWLDPFVHIAGEAAEPEEYRTRVKLLWDDNYLYVGAELTEEHIWGTMTERDSPLHRNNAFEIFIDPDGDSHNYIEFQVNALGTIMDLFLTKPYRDGGRTLSDWNFLDHQVAVSVDGEINRPQPGGDEKWTVEIALPLHAIQEAAPGRVPSPGDQWRIQFARAQRFLDVVDGEYVLRRQPGSDREMGADYWSWAPQGLVNLHYPEMWGFMQFSGRVAGEGEEEFRLDPDEQIKWALRRVYYRLKGHHLNHGVYTDDASLLSLDEIIRETPGFDPEIRYTRTLFEVTAMSRDGQSRWHIDQSGRIWKR